jgi:hypothetical protein
MHGQQPIHFASTPRGNRVAVFEARAAKPVLEKYIVAKDRAESMLDTKAVR